MTTDARMRGRFSCCGAPVSSLEIRAIYDGTCCWACYTCGALYRRWPANHAVTRRLVAWLATRTLTTRPLGLREDPDYAMTKPKPPLEKQEQAHGVRLLRSLGAAVYVLGTTRRAGDYQGTMQTPGIADVEAWLPHKARVTWSADEGVVYGRQLLKWEVKRARGARLSPEQKDYAAHCRAAGVDYVCGDLTALMRWLVADGYLRRDQLPAGRVARMSPTEREETP